MKIREKVTELFSKGLFRDSFYYTLGAFLVKGINFFLVPIYTAKLSPSDYGVLELYITFINILTIFCSLGFPQLILVEFYKVKGEERKAFFGTIFWGYTLFGFIICLLGGVLFSSISRYLTDVIAINFSSVLICSLISYITFYQTNFFNYLRLTSRSKLFMVFSIITGLTNAGLNLFLVVVREMGYNGILAGNFLILLLSCVCGYMLIRHKFTVPFKIDLKKFSGFTKIGIAFIASSLCQWLINGADRWIVLKLLNTTELGIYALAYKFSSFIDPLLITPLIYAYLPHVFKKYAQGDYDEKLLRISLMVLGLLIPFAVLVPLCLPMIITNPDYYEAKGLIPVLIAAYFFYFISQIAGNVMVYFKKINYMVLNILISGAVNLVMNYLLIRQMGIMGTAWAYLISNAVWAALNLRYRNKYLSELKQNGPK